LKDKIGGDRWYGPVSACRSVAGTYGVTFTLTGFATVQREGLVAGGGVITINADMRVGAVSGP
jgi:hypothetical protein